MREGNKEGHIAVSEFLEGTLERITFQAEDTGYTIARLQIRGNYDHPVTIVGPMAAAQPGESVRLEGFWTTHFGMSAGLLHGFEQFILPN